MADDDQERPVANEMANPFEGWTGTFLGAIQATLAAMLMFMGTLGILDGSVPRPTFWVSMILIVVCCAALGVCTDLRRRDVNVGMRELSMPSRARGASAFVSIAVAVTAMLCVSFRFRVAMCGMLVVGPYIAFVIDRIAGPALVLARTMRQARARRAWKQVVVLEDGPSIYIADEFGQISRVRSTVPLENGRAFADVRIADQGASYRSDFVPTVFAVESPEERIAREQMINAAIIGLLSGIGWIGIAFCPVLGSALCDWRSWSPFDFHPSG